MFQVQCLVFIGLLPGRLSHALSRLGFLWLKVLHTLTSVTRSCMSDDGPCREEASGKLLLRWCHIATWRTVTAAGIESSSVKSEQS